MLTYVKSGEMPTQLRGPVPVDRYGIPRYWGTIASLLLSAGLADGTLRKELGDLDHFYSATDELLGDGGLDAALAALDTAALVRSLEAYFIRLKGKERITAASERRWQAALRFVIDISERVGKSSANYSRLAQVNSAIGDIRLTCSNLHLGVRRRAERIRSLPAAVVEVLYEILDPASSKNPFRTEAVRWRVYLTFWLMLHLGLRRGETLLVSADCLKSEFDPKTEKDYFWIAVRFNEYEDDLRYSRPSLKRATSLRYLKVGRQTAKLIDAYAENFRGRPGHSFLLNSQKNKPLSTEAITNNFHSITATLPPSALKALKDHTGQEAISPHDLRHTCAVFVLNQYLSQCDMTEALQRMRTYFGWSLNSTMPLRYAKEVFEDRLATVWKDEFEERISLIRSLKEVQK